MKKIYCLLLLLIGCNACVRESNIMDLSGQWEVQIDSVHRYPVFLPGSLAENGVGEPVKDSIIYKLSEPVQYAGAAAYTKDIEIPLSWAGMPLQLYMERTKISEVYVNDSLLGIQRSVSAPHVYLIEKGLKAGINRFKIIVNNDKSLLPLGGSHAASEHTQTNWNGILGDFYLKCLKAVNIERLRIDASVDGRCLLSLNLLNTDDEVRYGEKFTVTVFDANGKKCAKQFLEMDLQPGMSSAEIVLNVDDPQLWDEYSPYLYTLEVRDTDGECKKTKFGIRDFKASGRQLKNNGRVLFLRGKHDGGVFPLTGYASMEKEDWVRYFDIVKSYGINHVRYHSWTPPAAAFEAADESGVFLQSELPLWGTYSADDLDMVEYMKEEGGKIMDAYGNHPSFVMFSLGNELRGDTLLMESVVRYLKEKDNRHLYAMGTNNFFWDARTFSCEDFFVAMRNSKGVRDYHTDLRGSFSFANARGGGLINATAPNTERDFHRALQGMNKPALGHETGQYQIFPDFSEIQRYTGVLRPCNLEVIKGRLENSGLYEQAEDFLKASGALSALCYREEIEMALRTNGFGGFQLLDLQDYPGQGTALVGILNAFMEPKNVISREKWMEFCNDVVPLARFPKYCWRSDEKFTADIEVANSGKGDLKNQKIRCSVVTSDNKSLFEKSYFISDLKQGSVHEIASIEVPFNELGSNQKLSLRVELTDTDYRNSWDI